MTWGGLNIAAALLNVVSLAIVIAWLFRNRRKHPPMPIPWGVKTFDEDNDEDEFVEYESVRRFQLDLIEIEFDQHMRAKLRLNVECQHKSGIWLNERYFEGETSFINERLNRYRIRSERP